MNMSRILAFKCSYPYLLHATYLVFYFLFNLLHGINGLSPGPPSILLSPLKIH